VKDRTGKEILDESTTATVADRRLNSTRTLVLAELNLPDGSGEVATVVPDRGDASEA